MAAGSVCCASPTVQHDKLVQVVFVGQIPKSCTPEWGGGTTTRVTDLKEMAQKVVNDDVEGSEGCDCKQFEMENQIQDMW